MRRMHRAILGGGLALAGLWAVGPAGAADGAGVPAARQATSPKPVRCPPPHSAVNERLVRADCSTCWAAADAPPAAASPARWTLDWIVPTTPEAPMSAAALPESLERAERIERGALAPKPHGPESSARLELQSGPAWSGYIGARLILRGRPPAQAQAWIALVEHLPPGAEGSAVRRDLVRSVSGPLPIDALRPGAPLDHLVALRWPQGAQPERLRARAWLEAPDGRILAMAADRCDAD